MQYRQGILTGVLVAAVFCWWAGPARAAEFSARLVTQFQSQEQESKIFMKGNRVRRETSTGVEPRIVIIVPEKKVVWILRPQNQWYTEMPITAQDTTDLMEMPKDQTQMKPMGTEQVNGYDTEKFETKMKHNDGEIRYYMWVSKKLGMPIKMISSDGSVTMEYRDIKEGEVADSLFEVPQGYQKITMPPAGMRPGIPPGIPKTK